MSGPRRTRRAREDPPAVLTPFDVMDAPELAALAVLEHAIDVARVALLAQHIDLIDPDPPFRREPQPGGDLTRPFLARAHALLIVIRRYRAAIAKAAVGLDGSRDDGGGSSDDDF